MGLNNRPATVAEANAGGTVGATRQRVCRMNLCNLVAMLDCSSAKHLGAVPRPEAKIWGYAPTPCHMIRAAYDSVKRIPRI